MEEDNSYRYIGEVYTGDNDSLEDYVCKECGFHPLETDYCFSCSCCGFCCTCSEDVSEVLCPHCKTKVIKDMLCENCGGCDLCICTCGDRYAKYAEVDLCPLCSNPVNFDDICNKCGNCLHGCCSCSR